jgi:hypothetical protein
MKEIAKSVIRKIRITAKDNKLYCNNLIKTDKALLCKNLLIVDKF